MLNHSIQDSSTDMFDVQ